MGWVACAACGATCPEFNARCSGCNAPLPSISAASLPGTLTPVGVGEAALRQIVSEPREDSLVGSTVGRYRVQARIGVGAMGVVYRAIDTELRRPVALKVLSPRLANDDRAKARMLREARATSQLDHPSIATVYEVGDHDGRPWIAMALYEGETLKSEIAKGPMDLQRVARIGSELASGLAAAHGAGVVHRDVKPANVVLTAGGAVKILDFGLAKVVDDGAEGPLLTRRGAVLGTVAYMAPEQLRGDAVDHRADLWALGVILYELAAGVLPFGATAERVVGEQLVPLSTRRPEVPSSLDELIAELLVREVGDRLGSAEEAERRLRAVAAELGRAVATTLDGSTRRTSAAPAEGPVATALAGGLVVADRFRLVRELGRGAMGAVWLAEHLGLGMRCAVKFIRDEHAELSDLRARFEREARAAALLKSRYVVQALDHGVWAGRPYIAMDYLEGETLAERLSRDGRLSLEETARVVAQVSKGLAKAHAAGIVHRDLKPENVFLTTDEEGDVAKILDFGVAKADWSGAAVGATQGGAILGTPAYMSPEQANGSSDVDHRSDLWSLGVIAFECVTGRRPFDSEAIGELYVQILSKPLPVPSRIAGDAPRGFDAWWARAATRERKERFQSASELTEALVTTLASEAAADPPDPLETAEASHEVAAERSSRRWGAPALAGAALIAVGVVLAGSSRGGGARPPIALRAVAAAAVARTTPEVASAHAVPDVPAVVRVAPVVDQAPPPPPSAEASARTKRPTTAKPARAAPTPSALVTAVPAPAASGARPPDPTLFDRRD